MGASHAEISSSPVELRQHRFIMCTRRSGGTSKAFYSSRPGCRPSGVQLIIFFFNNFNILSVFSIQYTVLSYNPAGLHSQTPRPGAVEDLGTAHEGGGCDQSIGCTVSDPIVSSCLWSTATRSSPLGYFSRLLIVVDN